MVVALVDDPRIVRARLRVVAVKIADRCRQALDQALLDPLVNQEVVGRDAALARVQELAPADAASRDVEVHLAIDDAGTLAAELERYRREMLSSCRHHHAGDTAAPGEEDVIELLGQKLGAFRHAAFDHLYARGIDVLGQQAGQQRRNGRDYASEGLTTAQLPAAMAPISGATARRKG